MEGMRKELNPVVIWVIVALVAIVVVFIGYRFMASGSFKAEQTGSEKAIQKVQQGERFYTPPAGAPVPGAGGMPGPGGMRPPGMGGGMNRPPFTPGGGGPPMGR